MVNGAAGMGVATALPRGKASARYLVAGVLVPLVTAAVAVAGLRAHLPGRLSPLDAVAFSLTFAWALAAAAAAMQPQRMPVWQVTTGGLTGAIALTAARLGADPAVAHHAVARAVATMAAPAVIAISAHFLLALPDGRLGGRARRTGAGLVYAAAAVTGPAPVITHRSFPVVAGSLTWAFALACVLPAARLRYHRAARHDQERLQWLGISAVLAADVSLITAVLHLLVGWPGPIAAVMAATTATVPFGVVASGIARLAPYGGRILVHMLSIAGFSVVVAVAYLVIVLGLGKAPANEGDRQILGLSMIAAAVAAAGYLPARDRLMASATRFVYGAREAPDEALRTFGSRMTRAVPMDELMLQLAESLRKTMTLTSAEIYTGTGDVLERAVSVPDAGPKPLLISGHERPVVTRAGVSGSAWASVWLPSLLDGRANAQLRVAPISHGGELLGLIVVERPAGADTFTEDDDRVLTELARQAGLAFHNVQLDAALQTTLDELRKQADELRESRARIVASADAERRRVERDLHDGAQQHLVALAVNLRLARDIIADDAKSGLEILDQLASDVQETIKELRELAHGIYPPLLVDSGLAEALRAAASRNPLDVILVVSDEVARYSPEVEAAIYFCCLEALQNAAKHAQGATVELRLWTEAGGLLFAVSDNGPGFDAARARGGHGFVNMADRLGAIGGTVRWESRPGRGSKISGSVPVESGVAGSGGTEGT